MWDTQRIVRLTKAAIRMERHPAVWKCASGVVILKPGKRGLYKVEGLQLYITASLHGKGGRESSRGAAVRRGSKMWATERQTIPKQERTVSHRCSSHHGQ